MAALTSLSFSATTQCSHRKSTLPSSTRFLASSSDFFGIRIDSSYYHHVGVRAANSSSKMVIQCMSSVTGLCLLLILFHNQVLQEGADFFHVVELSHALEFIPYLF
jgi:hypothetical protein